LRSVPCSRRRSQPCKTPITSDLCRCTNAPAISLFVEWVVLMPTLYTNELILSFGCGAAALGVMWFLSMSRSLQTMSGAVLHYDIVCGFQWRRQVGFAKHLPQIYFRSPAHL